MSSLESCNLASKCLFVTHTTEICGSRVNVTWFKRIIFNKSALMAMLEAYNSLHQFANNNFRRCIAPNTIVWRSKVKVILICQMSWHDIVNDRARFITLSQMVRFFTENFINVYQISDDVPREWSRPNLYLITIIIL